MSAFSISNAANANAARNLDGRAVVTSTRVTDTPAITRAAVDFTPTRTIDVGRVDRTDRPDRPERPDRPDRPDRPERPDRPGDSDDRDLGNDLASATDARLPFHTKQSVDGANDPADFAAFSAPGKGDVFVGFAARDGNPTLTVYDRNGAVLKQVTTDENDHASTIVPVAPGEIFKVGIDGAGSQVFYALRTHFTADAGDSAATATAIDGRRFGVAASVGRPDDPADYYSYTPTEDGKLRLRVDGHRGDIDPNLVVTDRNGVVGTGAFDADGHVSLGVDVKGGQTYVIGLTSPVGQTITYDFGLSYQTAAEAAHVAGVAGVDLTAG